MAFKLSSLKAKTAATPVVLTNPKTGEPIVDEDSGKEVAVYVYGKASKQYRDFNDSRLKSALEKSKKAGKIAAQNELTVEKIRKETIDFAVAMTSHIANMESEDGKAVDSPETIRAVYEDPEFYWVLDQVNAAIENDSNFI